eukprot:2398748-Prymnesium_polylepis.1
MISLRERELQQHKTRSSILLGRQHSGPHHSGDVEERAARTDEHSGVTLVSQSKLHDGADFCLARSQTT